MSSDALSEYSDPIVTANIYSSRRLDDLLRSAIVPFWASVDEASKEAGCRIWFMRYAKRGEHLKVRIHGPAHLREKLTSDLGRFVADYFQDTADQEAGEWLSNPAVPPIDVEDRPQEDQEDRSLLYTTYRRSPVCFGEPVFCQSDRHVALFCQAMAAQAELMLDQVAPYAGDRTFGQRRQNLLIKQVLSGLSAIGFGPAKLVEYLRHHRGWLTRSVVSKGDARNVSEQSVAAFYDGKLAQMSGAIDGLARLVEAELEGAGSGDPLTATWRQASSNFFAFVEGYRGDPRYDFDPYTDDHAFLPIYKVLHIGANQLGLRISNEAFIYYLLCRAAERAVGTTAADLPTPSDRVSPSP